MGPSPEDEGVLWRAILEAAATLGVERMLPRLVALKLPRERFLRIVGTKTEADRVKVLAEHRCRHGCDLRADQCFTALLVEAEVQALTGAPLEIMGLHSVPEGQLLVELGPLGGPRGPPLWPQDSLAGNEG